MAEIDAVGAGRNTAGPHSCVRKGGVMAERKFRAGQRVRLAPNPTSRHAGGGGYVITKQLPERDGEFEYRIKNISEPHERVARESELARE
jgi:hypothetical protein